MAGDNDSILRFEGVSVSFEDVRALDDVTFHVVRGQTRIVFGAAGSGKSVMLKTALGLVRPDRGHVILFGEDITGLREQELFDRRRNIGVLFQEGGLFDSLNIEENVSYPIVNRNILHRSPQDGSTAGKVREALRFVELEHTLEKFPSELSGGMRRRVGIARAMVTDPPFMVYDSPTAGLDPITANNIITLIAKARDTKKATTLIVTHRYQDGHLMANFRYNPETGELEHAPRDAGVHESTVFMVFREGRLVFEGLQEELERHPDPYVRKFKFSKD